jgi:hypothetical protein
MLYFSRDFVVHGCKMGAVFTILVHVVASTVLVSVSVAHLYA